MPTLYDAEGNEIEIPDNLDDLRNQASEGAKAAKKLAVAEARIAEIEVKERESALSKAFTEAGLEPTWAKWYEGDPDPEAAKAWAQAEGFPIKEPETEPKPETKETVAAAAASQHKAFVPTAGGTAVVGQAVTMEEIKEAIFRGDDSFIEQVAAEEAANPGRIAFHHPELLG